MTWDAAKKNCERDGAQLANPRNQWSQNFVELLALQVKGAVWIGMNKLEVQHTKPVKLKILNNMLCIDV